MVWEVDDDADGCINWDEFHNVFTACATIRQGMSRGSFSM